MDLMLDKEGASLKIPRESDEIALVKGFTNEDPRAQHSHTPPRAQPYLNVAEPPVTGDNLARRNLASEARPVAVHGSTNRCLTELGTRLQAKTQPECAARRRQICASPEIRVIQALLCRQHLIVSRSQPSR